VPGCDNPIDAKYEDADDMGFLSFSIPENDDDDPEGCKVFIRNPSASNGTCTREDFSRSSSRSCQKSEVLFDDGDYKESIVTEFRLVCEDDYKSPLVQSMFFAGAAVATVSFGHFSSWFGCRLAYIVGVVLMSFPLLGASFVDSYIPYIILQVRTRKRPFLS